MFTIKMTVIEFIDSVVFKLACTQTKLNSGSEFSYRLHVGYVKVGSKKKISKLLSEHAPTKSHFT